MPGKGQKTLAVCVGSTYTDPMATKTKRWTLRVTPAQDTIVRQVLRTSGCH